MLDPYLKAVDFYLKEPHFNGEWYVSNLNSSRDILERVDRFQVLQSKERKLGQGPGVPWPRFYIPLFFFLLFFFAMSVGPIPSTN